MGGSANKFGIKKLGKAEDGRDIRYNINSKKYDIPIGNGSVSGTEEEVKGAYERVVGEFEVEKFEIDYKKEQGYEVRNRDIERLGRKEKIYNDYTTELQKVFGKRKVKKWKTGIDTGWKQEIREEIDTNYKIK